MTSSSLRFSVVVPTLGRTERLGEMLKTLAQCRPQPGEVIVVDGEASTATRDAVERYREISGGTPALYLPGERGATVQRNLGLAQASGEIAVFVDDDVSFAQTPGVFALLAETFADPEIVGATARIMEDERRRFGQTLSDARRVIVGTEGEGNFTDYGYRRYLADPTAEADVEYMYGCFMCARADLARTVRFDEALTGYALCEDEDFSYRLSRHGRIRYVPSIVVEHDQFGRRNARAKNRMLVANRTYLFRKNFDQTVGSRAKFACFIGVLVGHRLINGEFDGARGLVEGIGDVMRGRVPYQP